MFAHARTHLFAVLAVTLVVGVLAISPQSLWIDEANSAEKAMAPSLGVFWELLVARKGSDLQMPMYMVYLWAWEKAFGHAEWSLRAANLPWLLLGQGLLYLGVAGRDRRLALLVCGLLAVWPMTWVYMDEARPYIVQLAGACAMAGALHRLGAGEPGGRFGDRGAWRLAVAGYVLLVTSSLLGVFYGLAGLLAMVLVAGSGWRSRLSLLATQKGPATLMAAVSVIMAPYYAWTLHVGAEAALMGGTVPQLVAFAGYELAGFSGLGPARLALREHGLDTMLAYWPGLAALAVCWVLLAAGGLRHLITAGIDKRERRDWVILGGVYLGLSVLLMVLLALAKDFRFLGRHCIASVPVLCLFVGMGLRAMMQTGPAWARLAGVGLVVLLTASSLTFRFGVRHVKDDYRGAAGIARSVLAHGGRVWWAADLAAARYYGLVSDELTSATPTRRLVHLLNPWGETLAPLPPPDLVVLSKPDVFDRTGTIAAWLREHPYHLQAQPAAFTCWAPDGAR